MQNKPWGRRSSFACMTLLLLVCLLRVGVTVASQDDSSKPVERSLLAYWNFDEAHGDVCRDRSGNGHDASPGAVGQPAFKRIRGPFGAAIEFASSHHVRISQPPAFERVRKLSLTAWVRPTDLSNYREIFRKEDGERRVLFSFQGNGTLLALGLNVGGYIECDAEVSPNHLLDGRWHHCAATFDGQSMRVYLDGEQVGWLSRPGEIDAGGQAPGCIGSSRGGECFQGTMDELRIYEDALTAEEIVGLYRRGAQAVAEYARELTPQIKAIYAPQNTFSRTLAHCRKRIAESGLELNAELAGAVVASLGADFPEDYADYVKWSATSPLEYLSAAGNDPNIALASHLVELLVEYMPATEDQWRRLQPEELAAWREAEAIQARFEALRTTGDTSPYSPDWIEIILDAGRRINLRPSQREAVAPYVQPHTPQTREYTADEAREILERDWMHQAGGNASPERIREEIAWTRKLAARIVTESDGGVDLSQELRNLDGLAAASTGLRQPDPEFYFRVRQVKRAITLRNPVVDFDRILFVDMPLPQGSEWRHETRHRLGYMAVPGGRLLVLKGLAPSGKVRQLMPQSPLHGSFWRPDLSWDGRKVVFCFKPHNEKSFHLYEINVDGTGLVQLTDGPFDDLDPIYLPDNQHVLFSTTRGHTYVRCMPPTNAFVLARCDRGGRNIYLTSRNNEPDYLPSVMNDGRVVYTRWEYTDKPLWRAQGLWTVNPDGTQVNTMWGNQSVWPDLLKDARSIPGSRRIMFTGSAHHNWFSGSVGILDPAGGFNFPDGLTKVTADVPWPESGNGPVDPVESPDYHGSGRYEAYYSPYPLGERDFLVSANRSGKFVLYLMDVDGNRELIHEGQNHILHAMPLKPRARPPVIADRVLWPSRESRRNPRGGVLYSSNVYHGAPPVLHRKARYLRVLQIEPKTYTYWNKRPYISTGPVVSMVQSEGVKRVIGTVPIERDGSVAFHAPTGKALHFQLLDENYRALQTMRSFTGVMPGEERGCQGCHQLHSTTPEHHVRSMALAAPPRAITPPPWGEDTVSYHRYVQPVLDQYCGSCHQGAGEARNILDLTARPGFLIFDEPYVTLIGRPSWGRAYQRPEDPPPGWGIANMLMVEGYDQRDPAAYRTPQPMTALSYNSRLIDLASSGNHYDVRVDAVSLRRLIAWVDAMCPYRGDQEVRDIPDPEFPGVDWLSVRPRIQTAPRIVRPGPVD